MLRASASLPTLKRAGYKGPCSHPTNEQRQELRRWWNNNSYGGRKHDDTKAWWKVKYSTEIQKSILSDTLSSKYMHLDDIDLSKYQAKVKKNRQPAWMTLEAALIEWQIRYD